jgi:hypothetical protein
MSDGAKAAMAIRFNRIASAVMLGLVAVSAVLILVGALPFDARSGLNLLFGIGLAALLFYTARSGQKDLDDPAGIEPRFQRGAVTLSAVLLVAGFALVVGIILWGLLG